MPSFGKNILTILFLTASPFLSLAAQPPLNAWVNSVSQIGSNLGSTGYSVTALTGSSQIIETDPSFGFPTAKLYTFKLCLAHPTEPAPLKNSTLTLEGTTVPLKVQILDDNCLSWAENVNFHFTARARYVTFLRQIHITKNHATTAPMAATMIFSQAKARPNSRANARFQSTETIPLQFAINPWLHGETSQSLEVADFIKFKPQAPVPASKAAQALSGEDQKDRSSMLLANDARINFQELGIDSKKGGKFLFDFRINPQIEVFNSANQSFFIKLNQGEFEFEAYLLSTLLEGENQVRRIVNPEPFKGPTQVREGALSFQSELLLPLIPTRGRLELAVVLKPKQKNSYLRSFKGIYLLGNFNDLTSNNFARLKTGFSSSNINFNFENYVGLGQVKDPYYADHKQDGLRPLKYEFEPLLFKLTRVGEESATRRQVYYQVRACVRNGADNTPLRGYHFVITKAQRATTAGGENKDLDLTPTIRRSEYDSCIYWDDRIDHSYYGRQQYFKAEYRIANQELNFDETLTAYINPWDISLSRDARTMEPEELKIETTEKKNKAQLFIPSYKIQTRTIQYSLDEFLRLKINKKVHLLIEPNVLNYSNLTKGIDSREPLRDGLWKIRWAVIHNRYEQKNNSFHLVARGEQILLATQGRIVAPLNIEFSDFRYLDSRNYLMLEVAPVKPNSVVSDPALGLIPQLGVENFAATLDTDSGIEPQTFIGPMIAGPDEEVGYLIPHPRNPALDSFIVQSDVLSNNTAQAHKNDGTSPIPGIGVGVGPNTSIGSTMAGLQNIIPQEDALVFEQGAPTWETLATLPNLSTPAIVNPNAQGIVSNFYLHGNSIQSWNLNEPEERIAIRRLMGPSPYTLTHYSMGYQRDLFQTEMLSRAFQRHQLTDELEDRLCFFFFDQNPKRAIHFPQFYAFFKRGDFWLRQCLESVRNSKKLFFEGQIEKRIDQISDVQYVGSTSSTLGVSASFTVSNSDTSSITATTTVGGQIGASANLSKFISIGSSASYSLAWSGTESQGTGNGLMISSGMNLNVRKLTLRFSGTYSEQCLTVELNPDLYNNPRNSLLQDLKKTNASSADIKKFLTQKVRLCHTEEEHTPIRGQEDFYFVTQDITGVSFIDNPDLRNRPVLLQIRGRNSYENFLKFVGAKLNVSQQTKTVDSDRLSSEEHTFKAIQMPIPTYPGLYIEMLKH